MNVLDQQDLAIIRGIPLEEEPGLGALTLPGFLAEVCERFGPREALVMHQADGEVLRWTYDEVWHRAHEDRGAAVRGLQGARNALQGQAGARRCGGGHGAKLGGGGARLARWGGGLRTKGADGWDPWLGCVYGDGWL